MATRTKQIALDEIQETFREQYKRIYDYEHEMLMANPGSSVLIQVQKIAYGDVMPPPYRRPSHRLVKKRISVVGEEEQSSRTHLSRKERNKDAQYVAQQSKKLNKWKNKKSSTNSHPPAAKGERKTASSQPTPKIDVKRKTASTIQPPSSAQPRGTTKPNYSTQHEPQSKKHTSPISLASSSFLTQPNTTSLPASQPPIFTSSSQPVGQFSIRNSGAPHVSPKKLRLMAKLPLRK
ncbi:hypothetical protein Ahy_B08g092528 [Arachis hypogaea]|uniref:Uncharacterized protein n=1 Tax=Arachis hypogaea TaxID=3818 RepID=A0A444Y440_ARAHY|nr:hypothetical protein Ahy_B08g092528 [Arachis hypogaea]